MSIADFSLDFPYAYGAPQASAQFRVEPEDFRVDEVLGFEPSGQGEHWLLHIRKRGENTAWVAEQLARLAGVSERDVGYCGRKDRQAVTSQWFSVYLPRQTLPDWQALNSESVQILASGRHERKLSRGGHAANRFVIRLRLHSSVRETLSRLARHFTPCQISQLSLTAARTPSRPRAAELFWRAAFWLPVQQFAPGQCIASGAAQHRQSNPAQHGAVRGPIVVV